MKEKMFLGFTAANAVGSFVFGRKGGKEELDNFKKSVDKNAAMLESIKAETDKVRESIQTRKEKAEYIRNLTRSPKAWASLTKSNRTDHVVSKTVAEKAVKTALHDQIEELSNDAETVIDGNNIEVAMPEINPTDIETSKNLIDNVVNSTNSDDTTAEELFEEFEADHNVEEPDVDTVLELSDWICHTLDDGKRMTEDDMWFLWQQIDSLDKEDQEKVKSNILKFIDEVDQEKIDAVGTSYISDLIHDLKETDETSEVITETTESSEEVPIVKPDDYTEESVTEEERDTPTEEPESGDTDVQVSNETEITEETEAVIAGINKARKMKKDAELIKKAHSLISQFAADANLKVMEEPSLLNAKEIRDAKDLLKKQKDMIYSELAKNTKRKFTIALKELGCTWLNKEEK